MNIRTPAACCHKHRSNNEVKWKTLMNTSTLPRSPTSLYIPVAGSKYTTVWWNKHSRTNTHTHSSREPWELGLNSIFLSFLIFFSWFPAHRKRRGQAQSVPALWGMAQPHWLSWGLKHKSAISCNRTRLGSRCSARTARWGSGKKKKFFFTNYHCQNYRAGLKISLNMLQVCYHCIGPLPGQSAKTSKIELIAKL